MADNDFKYALQDLTNMYVGAKSTYEELLEHDNVPSRFKEIIARIFLTEVAADTTLENHIFYMDQKSVSFAAYKKMKAVFSMSVWESETSSRKKKAGYVTRQYTIADIVQSEELHSKKDTILVSEVHISKMGMGRIVV